MVMLFADYFWLGLFVGIEVAFIYAAFADWWARRR